MHEADCVRRESARKLHCASIHRKFIHLFQFESIDDCNWPPSRQDRISKEHVNHRREPSIHDELLGLAFRVDNIVKVPDGVTSRTVA
jgi:hypothetical protein